MEEFKLKKLKKIKKKDLVVTLKSERAIENNNHLLNES